MKTTRIIIAWMCLMAIFTTWAEPIDETQARNIAANFMASHEMPSPSLKMVHKAPGLKAPSTSNQAAYYVFNADREGFVIVAGDDRMPAVLGYSETGRFDAQNVPEAMQELLESYSDQMAELDRGARVAVHLRGRSAIAPLVKSQWSQRDPYDILFPIINGKHAVVGCVATAMAQVLYYWKQPARTTRPIPAYTSSALSIYMPELPVVNFDWNNMRDTYLTDDTTTVQALAASQLSLYCAQSVNMDFKTKSSAAYSSDVPGALIYYFGYKSTAKYVKRINYSTEKWEELLYNELAARRPVYYSGSKASGGHAFICDGYDGEGRYHINWGWNGTSNGYFLLNVLNPDEQGTGSADGSYGYIYSQAMVTGVEPGNAPNNLEVTTKYIELQSLYGTRSSTSSNFSVTQLTHFLNHNTETISFDFGWGLYHDNTLVKVLSSGTKENLSSYYYTYVTRSLSFGSGITSGTYRIIPIYSEIGASNWRPCIGSEINYIEVTINGNQCTAICHGTANSPDFQVNSIDVTGHMHPNRPVNISLNVTNKGYTRNDLIYMFANGEFYGTAYVDLKHGESGNATFMYSKETTGNAYLTFCLNEDGTNIIGSRTITINSMPYANLTGEVNVLNVSDAAGRVITSDKFSIELTVTNNNTTTYDEDITFRIYKQVYGNYGTLVQTITKPLNLARRQKTTMQIDFDNVMDGWKYFVKSYYYSSGEEKSLAGSYTYTIVFPDTPTYPRGDVNGDYEVNISDVNAVIGVILGKNNNFDIIQRADVDQNGEVNIADVNAIIAIILSN